MLGTHARDDRPESQRDRRPVTLTGATARARVTILSLSTLHLGNGGTTGSFAGNIADNSVLPGCFTVGNANAAEPRPKNF